MKTNTRGHNLHPLQRWHTVLVLLLFFNWCSCHFHIKHQCGLNSVGGVVRSAPARKKLSGTLLHFVQRNDTLKGASSCHIYHEGIQDGIFAVFFLTLVNCPNWKVPVTILIQSLGEEQKSCVLSDHLNYCSTSPLNADSVACRQFLAVEVSRHVTCLTVNQLVPTSPVTKKCSVEQPIGTHALWNDLWLAEV